MPFSVGLCFFIRSNFIVLLQDECYRSDCLKKSKVYFDNFVRNVLRTHVHSSSDRSFDDRIEFVTNQILLLQTRKISFTLYAFLYEFIRNAGIDRLAHRTVVYFFWPILSTLELASRQRLRRFTKRVPI